MVGATPSPVFCAKSAEAIDGKGVGSVSQCKRVRNCMKRQRLDAGNRRLEETKPRTQNTNTEVEWAGRATITMSLAQTGLCRDSTRLISYFRLLFKYVHQYYLSRWKTKG